jgi:hypothetical protein
MGTKQIYRNSEAAEAESLAKSEALDAAAMNASQAVKSQIRFFHKFVQSENCFF